MEHQYKLIFQHIEVHFPLLCCVDVVLKCVLPTLSPASSQLAGPRAGKHLRARTERWSGSPSSCTTAVNETSREVSQCIEKAPIVLVRKDP